MPATIDTKSVQAVAAASRDLFRFMFPAGSPALLDRLFSDVARMFGGKFPDYRAIDMRYHDFEHTLQATLCLTRLLAGRHRAAVEPILTRRQFERGLASVLLHDTGYLKRHSDREGTGAKYTFCHVQRSCDMAANYLPSLGFAPAEITVVQQAIACTGPRSEIHLIPFSEPIGKFIGSAVATADYLGQMAAPDYVDELPILFGEFEESDDFEGVPAEKRIFKSASELIKKTPGFWEKFVRPKLETDFGAAYRFLADPYPDGPNAYIEAIERNIACVRQLAASAK